MIIKNRKFESDVKNEISNASLISVPGQESADEYAFFRKTFFCDKLPKVADFDIFVQSEFILYVNGEFIARADSGISKGGKLNKINILPYLKQGKNVIAVFACFRAYPTLKVRLRQKGVIFSLKLDYTGARQEEIVSDKAVKCMACEAFLDSPELSKSKSHIEIFDNNKYPSDWMEIDYDDTDWLDSRVTPLSDTCYFDMGKGEYELNTEHMLSAKAIIAAGADDDVKGVSIKETIYSEAVECKLNKLYVVGTECEIQPVDKGQHSYILVDFDKLCTGYIKLEITGYIDDVVDVIFAKKLVDSKPEISGAARFILKAEDNILETKFDKNEFRYVMLVFRNPVRTNILKGVWAIESKYPFENTSEFSCSDEEINTVFENAASYLKTKFSNQVIPTESITGKNSMFAQRPYLIANSYLNGGMMHFKNTLKDFASMANCGYVTQNRTLSGNVDFYDMYSYVLALKDYCVLCDDIKDADKLFESAVSIFYWISKYENNGVLKPVLVRNEFKSEALLNISYIYALKALSEVAGIIGDRQAARFYETKSEKLLKSFKNEIADKETFARENKDVLYDICSVYALVSDDSLFEKYVLEINENSKIYMPTEFVRATKKAGKLEFSYTALKCEVIGFEGAVIAVIENILGIDFSGKKGIKSIVDTNNFDEITGKIYSPKGIVDVSVKKGEIENNTLSVNINDTDGEL